MVFVNGCFWHGHDCPVGSRLPKSNTEFWMNKRLRNQERDEAQRTQLSGLGWAYLDVWECQILADENLIANVKRFLKNA